MGSAEDSSIATPIAVIAVILNFVGSWLSDHIRIKYHLFAYSLGMIISMVGLLHLTQQWGRVLLITGTGVMGGMSSVVSGVTWPRFFGRKHLGAVSGFNMALTVFSSAIGPTIFSISLHRTGTYDTATWCCLILMVPLLIGSMWGNNPQPKGSKDIGTGRTKHLNSAP